MPCGLCVSHLEENNPLIISSCNNDDNDNNNSNDNNYNNKNNIPSFHATVNLRLLCSFASKNVFIQANLKLVFYRQRLKNNHN